VSIFRRRVQNLAPVPYVSRRAQTNLFSLSTGKDGATPSADQLAALADSGTLFAVIEALSTAVAAPDWLLYRQAPDNTIDTDDEREPVAKHAALDLWNKPNEFMHGAFLRELVQMHIDLTGEGAILLIKAGGIPLEMWPVRPDKLTPVAHPTKFLSGWIYTDPDGEKIPFKVDEVLHIRKPHPSDPYRGMGAVGAISTDLDSSKYSREWVRNFFLNSAEPGGIIEVDRRLSDDEFDELVARWNEQHKGVQRAHRVALLEAGKYVSNAFNMRDMQFVELRTQSRDVIMEAFRISKTQLGISDDVNRAAAMAAEYQFAKNVTLPRLVRWRDMANFQLLPQFGSTGKGVEFDFVSPVADDAEIEALDRTSKVNAVSAIMKLPGVKFDVNEVFAAYGLPELDFEEVEIPIPGMPGAPGDPNSPPGQVPASPDQADPKKSDDKQKPKPKPANVRAEAPEVDMSGLARDWQTELDGLLDDWRDITAEQRAELREQIISAIDDLERGGIQAGALARLAELAVNPTRAIARLVQALTSMWHKASGRASREAAEDGAVVAPAELDEDSLRDLAEAVATMLAGALAAAAGREALRSAGEGKSGAQVAQEVDEHLKGLSDRPQRDALGGALTGTQNRARIDTWKDGPVGSLYADETLDENTCVNCRAIHGRFIATTEDLGAVDKLYTAMGGYVDCLGRERCRGTITGVWRPQTVGGDE